MVCVSSRTADARYCWCCTASTGHPPFRHGTAATAARLDAPLFRCPLLLVLFLLFLAAVMWGHHMDCLLVTLHSTIPPSGALHVFFLLPVTAARAEAQQCDIRASDCYDPGTASFIGGNNCRCVCESGYRTTYCTTRSCTISQDCYAANTASVSGNVVRGTKSCSCSCNAPYGGSLCDTRICHKDFDCNGRGVSISGNYGSCICACQAGYTGVACQDVLCTMDDCSAAGTNSVSDVRPSCQCACKPQYNGLQCQNRICHKDFDCNGRGTSISGSYPSCTCACQAGYDQAACQRRVCHHQVDCSGRGTAVTGTYPDCTCACRLGYGGKRCRTLSQSASLSRTLIKSVSPSQSATVTGSASKTESSSGPTLSRTRRSPTSSPSGSATVTKTSSSSRSLNTPTPLASASASPSLTPSPSVTATAPTIPPTVTHTATLSHNTTRSDTPSGSPSPSASGTQSASRSVVATASVTCPVETMAGPGPATARPDGAAVTVLGDRAVGRLRRVSPVVNFDVRYEDLAAGLFPRLLLRTDLRWKEDSQDVYNISGVFEALVAPELRWQPRGMRSRGAMRVAVDVFANGSVFVALPALPRLLLDEPEVAHVMVPAADLLGCGGDGVWLSLAQLTLRPGPSLLGAALMSVTAAGAALGDASDLQALAVMGIMPCGSGLTRRLVAGSYRALSPLALGDGLSDVSTGNALAVGGGLIVAVCASLAISIPMRRPGGGDDETGLVRVLSLLRLPAVVVTVLSSLYQGTLAAAIVVLAAHVDRLSGRVPDGTSADVAAAEASPATAHVPDALGPGELAAAVVCVLLAAAFPAALVLASKRFVTRSLVSLDYTRSLACPTEGEPADSPPAGNASSSPPTTRMRRLVVWLLLPRAVLHPKPVAAMFGPIVAFQPAPEPPPLPPTATALTPAARCLRAVRHHHAWPTAPLWSSWVLLLAVAVPVRNAGWCLSVFVLAGLAHCALAAVIAIVLPHVARAKSVLAAAALAINGCVLLASALLVDRADSAGLRGLLEALIALQTAVGALRTAHTVGLAAWLAGSRLALRRRWFGLGTDPSDSHTGPAPSDGCEASAHPAPRLWTAVAASFCVVEWLGALRVRVKPPKATKAAAWNEDFAASDCVPAPAAPPAPALQDLSDGEPADVVLSEADELPPPDSMLQPEDRDPPPTKVPRGSRNGRHWSGTVFERMESTRAWTARSQRAAAAQCEREGAAARRLGYGGPKSTTGNRCAALYDGRFGGSSIHSATATAGSGPLGPALRGHVHPEFLSDVDASVPPNLRDDDDPDSDVSMQFSEATRADSAMLLEEPSAISRDEIIIVL